MIGDGIDDPPKDCKLKKKEKKKKKEDWLY